MPEQRCARVVVANSSSRELDRLAAELAARGTLDLCVRSYVGLNGRWDKALRRVPGLGLLYSSTLGRRQLPLGLLPQQVVQLGISLDFISAIVARVPFGLIQPELLKKLMWFRESALGRKAARFANRAPIFVSASWIAKSGFKAARQAGAITVLNFQTAHHRYVRKLLQEEMQRVPEFAGTLAPHLYPSEVYDSLDAEIELADHVLVGSSFAKSSFVTERVGESKISVIPYGTDISKFAPRTPKSKLQRELRILFVGQISQLKGLSYLLRGYERIKGGATRLTLVGNPVDRQQALLRYQSGVTHIAHVPHSEMPQIYQDADVFVFPTLADGMGLAVLEAMASGLPVVVTPNGPGDLVRDGVDGFVVPIRDSDAIAERLYLLQSNPDMRIAMGHSARLRAEQFSWETYARQAADLVLSLARVA